VSCAVCVCVCVCVCACVVCMRVHACFYGQMEVQHAFRRKSTHTPHFSPAGAAAPPGAHLSVPLPPPAGPASPSACAHTRSTTKHHLARLAPAQAGTGPWLLRLQAARDPAAAPHASCVHSSALHRARGTPCIGPRKGTLLTLTLHPAVPPAGGP